jgi:hypothetical protein
MPETTQEQKLSPEEMEKTRIAMTEFYTKELPLLRNEAEYFRLLSEIEHSKYTRMRALQGQSQIFAEQAAMREEAGKAQTEQPDKK